MAWNLEEKMGVEKEMIYAIRLGTSCRYSLSLGRGRIEGGLFREMSL